MPTPAFYEAIDTQLRQQGPGHPVLVLDRDALDHNLDVTARHAKGERVRLVVKSLPCAALLERAMRRLDTKKLMVFHGPFLTEVANRFPDADVLMGKPLPIRAIEHFYDRLPDGATFDPAEQVQWLVDDAWRVEAMGELAEGYETTLRLSVEIDIGLHRGGLDRPEQLHGILDRIEAHPRLELGGLMGYDAHVAKAPAPLTDIDRALRDSAARYQAFVDVLNRRLGEAATRALTLNGAGSPTFALHGASSPANELSLGSALVKPTDFDLSTLDGHRPALYLAVPVLKRLPGFRMPFLEKASALAARHLPGLGSTLFLYGGGFMAKPIWPPSLRENPLYGRSTNQQIMNVRSDEAPPPEHHVFFRPTQSEAVMLRQDGLYVFSDGEIIGRWEVFGR